MVQASLGKGSEGIEVTGSSTAPARALESSTGAEFCAVTAGAGGVTPAGSFDRGPSPCLHLICPPSSCAAEF